ncbi:MAG: 1-acyl-sn-glycerol-3-phosphate acyltransferase [Candidatus Aminicenantes bacterium]|nr:1-acyl-sn-glycerol-3-phosphate acyltransferase [Candidatus Aminicenantes bacterium]
MRRSTHEEELRRIEPAIRWLGRIGLVGKSVMVHGGDSIPAEGPAILIGNHCGAFKDVMTLFRIVPRPIFFNANKQIFTRPEFSALTLKHLKRHLGRVGVFLNFLLNPFKFLVVDYVSANIAKIGTIPVDLLGRDKREAVEQCMDYLRRGRAVVSLQGRGRVDPRERNPYIKPFGRGSAIVACRLHLEERLDVPVVPLAFYGTHLPWAIPGQIRVGFGRPFFARDHLAETFEASVGRLKAAVEAAVHRLFMELLRR